MCSATDTCRFCQRPRFCHGHAIPDDGSVCVHERDPECWLKRRLDKMTKAVRAMREHVFADLPEAETPPRNRLQVIAAKADEALRVDAALAAIRTDLLD